MGVPKGTKPVQWYLQPDLIVRVQIEAAATGRTQSKIVAEAIEDYLSRCPPRRKPDRVSTVHFAR